jgi:hypothetical protein
MTDTESMRRAYLEALTLGLTRAEEDLNALVVLAYDLVNTDTLSEDDRQHLLAVLTACESL